MTSSIETATANPDFCAGLRDWIAQNHELLGGEARALLASIGQLERNLSSLQSRKEERPCIGVIGASGSGKTHLIAALAERGTRPLPVVLDGAAHSVDFLADIDRFRHGGAMAVLRFTTNDQGRPAKFPVAVQLLGCVDLVKIFAATCLSGQTGTAVAMPDAAGIEELAMRLARSMRRDTVPGWDVDDARRLRDYCETRYCGSIAMRALAASGYWDYLDTMMPRLEQEARTALLSVMWGRDPHLGRLYNEAVNALDKLGFERQAYCAVNAICNVDPVNGAMTGTGDAIMALEPFLRYGRIDDDAVLSRSAHGAWAAIKRSVLTLLTAEVNVLLGDGRSDLFRHVDVLEFPGFDTHRDDKDWLCDVREPAGRDAADPVLAGAQELSATELFSGETETARTPVTLLEHVARFKARHLLEDYCERGAITTMVACASVGQPDLNSYAPTVNFWLERTQGTGPAERELRECGLFIVLTKLDELIPDDHQSFVGGRTWDDIIDKALISGLAHGQDWSRQWSTGRPFDNLFLFRSPHHNSPRLCDYLSNGMELCIKANRAGDVAQAWQHYLRSPLVMEHVEDHPGKWREALEAGDGGRTILKQFLGRHCSAGEKGSQLEAAMAAWQHDLADRFRRFLVWEDRPGVVRSNRSAAQVMRNELRKCIETGRLGRLQFLLQPEEDEILNLLHNLSTDPFREGLDGQSEVKRAFAPEGQTLTGNLRDRGRQSAPGPALNGTQTSADADDLQDLSWMADRLSGAVLDYWTAALVRLSRSRRCAALVGMRLAAFKNLICELLIAITRHDLKSTIARAIQQRLTKNMETARRNGDAAIVAAEIICRFIDDLGYDERWAEHHPRRPGRAQDIIFPPRKSASLDAYQEARMDLGRLYSSDWMIAAMAMVEDNREYIQRIRRDMDDNRTLGVLLSALDPCSGRLDIGSGL